MKKTKILIVEDEAVVSLFLKVQLVKRGYFVSGQVATGEDAIQAVQKEEPDIILMDIHLGGKIDGLQAASAIRQFSNVNIIAMTGYEDEELRIAVDKLTSSAILIKPVSIKDIIIVIEQKFKYIV
jgi:DNA-binding response OmpR family regulator